MKAVLLTNHGGPEMLRYGDAPVYGRRTGRGGGRYPRRQRQRGHHKVRLGGGPYGSTSFRISWAAISPVS